MTDLPLDHVAVATHSIREAAPLYELLTGATCSLVEQLPEQGASIAFVGSVELVEPLGDDSGVRRFLERRGPGLHHIAYRVTNLTDELLRLKRQGVRLIDQVPRAGAGGHRVAFLHPDAGGGVLIELVERAVSDP